MDCLSNLTYKVLEGHISSPLPNILPKVVAEYSFEWYVLMLMNRIIELLEEEKYLADVDTWCACAGNERKISNGEPKGKYLFKGRFIKLHLMESRRKPMEEL